MTSTTATRSLCTCGCGTPVNKANSLYKPGHDARHAGLVARAVVEGAPADLLKSLPSNPLRMKAINMVNRLTAPKAASPKSGAPVIADAPGVKVGRWVYPARTVDGLLERNTKRNGSGTWVAV